MIKSSIEKEKKSGNQSQSKSNKPSKEQVREGIKAKQEEEKNKMW